MFLQGGFGMATPLDSLGIVHETDVLILGAGASGCGAALSASRHGLRVLLPTRANWKAAAPSVAATTISWRC